MPKRLNHLELCLFTESMAKMLQDGIIFSNAVEVAARNLRHRSNRNFAHDFKNVFTQNHSNLADLDPYRLPTFYRAMLHCGQITGNLPETLKAAGQYLRQITPIAHRMSLCWQVSIFAFLASLLFRWAFLGRIPFLALMALAIVFVLPRYLKPVKYYRDWFTCHFPLIAIFSRQLALMEFFTCLKFAYNTSYSTIEMFNYSIQSISNAYLRKQMARSIPILEQRNSFTAAIHTVKFIPTGLAPVLNAAEISGTMDRFFENISENLTKSIEAKVEAMKFMATALIINCGILSPLMIILPLFIPKNAALGLAVAYMMGMVPIVCLRAAIQEYLKKTGTWDLSFEHLHDNDIDT